MPYFGRSNVSTNEWRITTIHLSTWKYYDDLFHSRLALNSIELNSECGSGGFYQFFIYSSS